MVSHLYVSESVSPAILAEQKTRYIDYIKRWAKSGGKERYAMAFKGKYRVYLPLTESKLQGAIAIYLLKTHNMVVTDYAKGLAEQVDYWPKKVAELKAKGLRYPEPHQQKPRIVSFFQVLID
jgi:hypothetical protein